MLNLFQHPSGSKRGAGRQNATLRQGRSRIETSVLAEKWALKQVQGDEFYLGKP